MLNYESLMTFYTNVHARIWKMFFSSNFKRFGVNSRIIFPLMIENSKYMEIGEFVRIQNKAGLIALKIDDHIPRLIIDDYTRIEHFFHIVCVRDIHIGKNVLIAPNVFISDNIHGYEDPTLPVRNQPMVFKRSVFIGDDSFIGRNASIIGARIGKHCVIGSNSVVTSDIPDYCIAAGIPAKIIKRYDFDKNVWQKVIK